MTALPAASQTLPALRQGQTIEGRLDESSPQLPDGTRYALYRYEGDPGERIIISMRSSELDTYLWWGRMTAGVLRVEAANDDGGSGTDSEMEVTVGPQGEYAVRASSYGAEERGRFVLSVRRAPRGTDDRPREGESWTFAYSDPDDARLVPLVRRFQDRRTLERTVSRLNAEFALPRPVTVRMDECGSAGAYWNPNSAEIVFCHEMLGLLAEYFAPELEWTQKQQEAVDGAIAFILMHEVGHALVSLLDLPITGREEDAVDQLATLLLLETGEKGTRGALSGILAIQPEPGEEIDPAQYAGVHSLSPQRYYNVLCWIYATDPARYAPTVGPLVPQYRLVRCPGEYVRFSNAWARLLAPHRTD